MSFEAKRPLFLLRSWLPHSPFSRAFSTIQAMLSARISLGETNRVESFVPTTTSTECRHCKVFFLSKRYYCYSEAISK
ncbi:hypothetical protein BDA96_01G344600 [Sorghum bicolor]|uniref:Uncharacterized protein n=2 Tax=Sorghum bicolor TaxID=4558 RepID=A0A921S1X0_SORBI|nr:hypothetical protein BDA96_01G344600 [Sorghum bicolor]KXG39045.1 hypothetical protein SORBI_3001G321300 [Sorghum bicolor]